MARIFIPTRSPDDWKSLLAQPDLHWKEGYSPMTLAKPWERPREEALIGAGVRMIACS